MSADLRDNEGSNNGTELPPSRPQTCAGEDERPRRRLGDEPCSYGGASEMSGVRFHK